MKYFWLVFMFGYAAGLAVEKWSYHLGWPDKSTIPAWLATTIALSLCVWLAVSAQREEDGS